jgi:diacylglycerol kinase (ATP)
LNEARQVLISRNPNAGARDNQAAVAVLSNALRHHGLEPAEFTELEALTAAVQVEANARRLRCVVAAGGDGTVSLLANVLSPDTPLAILPLGTENLLSQYLELEQPASPQQVAHWIAESYTIQLDAGLANDRLFLLMVGCGFDAEVVRRLHAQRTGHIQHFSYIRPILEAIHSYRYPPLRVCIRSSPPGEMSQLVSFSGDDPAARLDSNSSDGDATYQRARWAFVVNLPQYAGGLRIAPMAIGSDGLLDVCTFRQGSLWHGLRYLIGVAMGRHRRWSDYRHTLAREVRIECDEPIPYQCDGDPGGFLPVTVRVLPKRLRLIANPSWATGASSSEFQSPSRGSQA